MLSSEYIISEAMHALGIATTRSLAVVTTGESVIRETDQPGACCSFKPLLALA